MPIETLKALLRKNGSSLTKPRRTIFSLLQNQKPQNMQVLVGRAKDKVDRATVYRTMELFEKLGIVNRLNIGWKYKYELSDIFQDHHHHFHCSSCGTTFNLEPNSMLETMIDTVAGKSGFSPRGHQLEIYGLCSNCQQTA
ncbi:MAG TPA: Fur family transcriptional regulator [Candidatus Saccharimonadales bacterium]|nr:Fur family transcriptional regulator [Candidatus Saccharimonadales bacterium]